MNKVELHGVVTRKPYTSERFAAFSLRPPPVDGRSSIIDVVAFDAAVIAAVGLAQEGDAVSVVGHLGSKKLTNKAKEEAQIDGRVVWILQVVADSVEMASEPGGAADEPAF
jgi:single-stranded DNA-binding protein